MEEGTYRTFKWIGRWNYMREKEPKSGIRTRVENLISADACVRFEGKDGRIHAVLIAWKHTEPYEQVSPGFPGNRNMVQNMIMNPYIAISRGPLEPRYCSCFIHSS